MAHRFLCIVALGALLTPKVHAEPEHSLTASPVTRDCERAPECMASVFADLLTEQPEPRELRLALVFRTGSARVYSADRERLAGVARAWRRHPNWGAITVEGYGDASDAGDVALARRRAERVRGYLVRYGVDPEHVIAIGRGSAVGDGSASDLNVDLTIAFCDRSSGGCGVEEFADAAVAALPPSTRAGEIACAEDAARTSCPRWLQAITVRF